MTAVEVALIGIALDAIGKVFEGHRIGGTPATPADVDEAKARLDKTKADLDAAIEEEIG